MWTHRLFASLSRVIVMGGCDYDGHIHTAWGKTLPGCLWSCVYVCMCVVEKGEKG